jgi:hypothetical protein
VFCTDLHYVELAKLEGHRVQCCIARNNNITGDGDILIANFVSLNS